MRFYDYTQEALSQDNSDAGELARLAGHSSSTPVDSGEISDWHSWLVRIHASDVYYHGLMKAWFAWKNAEQEERRCPECGQLAQFSVCDVWVRGKRMAQISICPEHGQFFIVDKAFRNPDKLEEYARVTIARGLVRQQY